MKSRRCDRFLQERRIPTFSSALLDQIYRSIDEDGAADRKESSSSSYRGTEETKHANRSSQSLERKGKRDEDRYYYSPLFSSSSSSSSSSASSVKGFLSSSSQEDCSVPCLDEMKLRPVRTAVSDHPESRGRRERIDWNPQQQRKQKISFFDDYLPNSVKEVKESNADERFNNVVVSKSRASKMYSDLKKMKQSVSPGGRLAAFFNSLFTARTAKKKSISSSSSPKEDDYYYYYGDAISDKGSQKLNWSSDLTFSGSSCLIRKSPPSSSSKAKSCDGVKRTVRFHPVVSVVFHEDCRPCGRKLLNEEDPNAIRETIMRTTNRSKTSSSPNDREELRSKFWRKSQRARDIFKKLHQIQKKTTTKKKEPIDSGDRNNKDEDEDDEASDSSSDLFELDHLALIGNGRYCKELPVYETTRIDTNKWSRS